jgi:DNA mismatch endonuclease (patch repair protein)
MKMSSFAQRHEPRAISDFVFNDTTTKTPVNQFAQCKRDGNVILHGPYGTGKSTQFELNFLRLLSAELYPLGYRYRKHCRNVTGTPDIAFPQYRVAIFLDSDFWHGRNYDKLASRMNSFWRAKIERNMERDRQVNRRLRRDGWSVLRFGEFRVKRRPMSIVRLIKIALERRARAMHH